MIDELEVRLLAEKVDGLGISAAEREEEALAGMDLPAPPTVIGADPMGRRIWEAQWSEEDAALMCFVPDDAVIIDGDPVTVTVDDGESQSVREDDEVNLSAGTWYLHVLKNNDTGECLAQMTKSAAAPSVDNAEEVLAARILTVLEDGSVTDQYIVGSVIFSLSADGDGTGEDHECDKYFGDVASISKHSGSASDSGTETGNVFQLAGFGKYSLDSAGQGGSYRQPVSTDVTPDQETDFAVVCRDGNTEAVNGNTLSYRRLRMSATPRTAFRIEGAKGSRTIVDCYYNAGGIVNLAGSVGIEGFLGQEDEEGGSECFLAFSLNNGIVAFPDLGSLQSAQRDADDYVVALYRFDAAGELLTDLRTAPQIQVFEEGLV